MLCCKSAVVDLRRPERMKVCRVSVVLVFWRAVKREEMNGELKLKSHISMH